mmetsp:Transcript_29341/g.65095  ORF Transcript_29341/g.65095 Transcript_29341/m.65095 type:complete len:262 (+) Transcript_29341:456-1241(+)
MVLQWQPAQGSLHGGFGYLEDPRAQYQGAEVQRGAAVLGQQEVAARVGEEDAGAASALAREQHLQEVLHLSGVYAAVGLRGTVERVEGHDAAGEGEQPYLREHPHTLQALLQVRHDGLGAEVGHAQTAGEHRQHAGGLLYVLRGAQGVQEIGHYDEDQQVLGRRACGDALHPLQLRGGAEVAPLRDAEAHHAAQHTAEADVDRNQHEVLPQGQHLDPGVQRAGGVLLDACEYVVHDDCQYHLYGRRGQHLLGRIPQIPLLY